MDGPSYKHEIKTVFITLNSCIALSLGLFPLSVGAGAVVCGEAELEHQPEVPAMFAGVGSGVLALAALGHCGAFRERRAWLRVYAAAAGLLAAAQGLVLAWFASYSFATVPIAYGIFHVAATLLAMVLALLFRRVLPAAAASPASAPTAL